MSATRASLIAAAVFGLLLAGFTYNSAALAQVYPPPIGSLSTQAAPALNAAGATTTITATVLDSSGQPVASAPVLFQIQSQPGTDARFANGLTQTEGVTDASGKATAQLLVGSAPGSIVIKTTSGEKVSQLTVQVQTAPVGPPVAPPPGGGTPPREDRSIDDWQAVVIAAGVIIVLGGAVMAARRRRA